MSIFPNIGGSMRRVAAIIRRSIATAALLLVSAPACLASSTGDLKALRTRALELVNDARRADGVEPLELSAETNEAAMSHAGDMLRRHYYSHTSPDGKTVRDRYIAAGGSKWRLTAENIARCAECPSPPDIGAVERLHRGWMQSPGHRANILRRGLTEFGFGIISAPRRGQYAVQTFAGPGVAHGEEKSVAIPPDEQNAAAIVRINRARDARGRAPLQSSTVMIDLAQSALPASRDGGLKLDQNMDLYRLLPADQRRSWRSISLLAAACGGCGTEPTRADARYFVQRLLDDKRYRDDLMSHRFTHLGFIIAADGEGKKIGVAVLGQHSKQSESPRP